MINHPKNLYIIPLLVVLIFSLPQNFLFAKSPSSEDKLNKKFILNLKNDFVEVLVSPKNWKGKDLLNFSAVIGTGLLLYALDDDIHQWTQDNQTPLSKDFFKFINHSGDGVVVVGLMAALYTSGEVFHDNSLRKTALLSLESWLTSGVIVLGLKSITGRARPWTGESSHTFHPFSIKPSFTSLPSAHSSSAFSVATVIAYRSKKTCIDILAYSLASLVAISRVHNNKHWPSDVLVGSFIGYFVGKKICSLDRGRDSDKMRVNFQFTRQRQALSITFSF